MSSLFNLHLPLTVKREVSHHPWERVIKDVYANKIKHAHNSANNPHYPKKKEKPFESNRVKFSIIGNRVTKEFIYCANLVKGLHRWRKKSFESPVIRGVTNVDWPTVLNDLKLKYGGLLFCLKSQVAVFINDKFIGGEIELKELIETKYNYHIAMNYPKEAVAQFATFIRGIGRPCAYLHVGINGKHMGTMLFMLYADIVPYTCENFLRLCKKKKGGYSGTPVHRIVKDGWIQCGGFGLKSAALSCENFIVPHDRRGVLAMANNGRHVDCSTQFFILLQPAPWMAFKYVAFGQLIDGAETLKEIESVQTWYESPTSDIVIHKSGVFNMDCQDIMINRGAAEYIHGHIEDLVALGDILYEEIIIRVFLELEFRRIALLEMKGEGEALDEEVATEQSNIHATERFLRKKEEMQNQLEKSVSGRASSAKKKSSDQKSMKMLAERGRSMSMKSQLENRPTSAVSQSEPENNEFDVSEYGYEPEDYMYYEHVSVLSSRSTVSKSEKPYYIALTNVPYPGEVDSDYDLKKFLKGDYCLESDLEVKSPQKAAVVHKAIAYPSEMLNVSYDEPDRESVSSMDSDEEKEIRRYIKLNVDRVSFAGSIVRGIARAFAIHNLFEGTRKSELVTDDELRRFRVASTEQRAKHEKKVSISMPESQGVHREIKRRQTGFVRPEDLEKIHIIQKTSSYSMADDTDSTTSASRPYSESLHKSMMLTFSPNLRIKNEDGNKEQFRRTYVAKDSASLDQMMNFQSGMKMSKMSKMSTDFIKNVSLRETKQESSLRSIEFSKMRPSMTVNEYQAKNRKYKGLRLPGDTPLHSMTDVPPPYYVRDIR